MRARLQNYEGWLILCFFKIESLPSAFVEGDNPIGSVRAAGVVSEGVLVTAVETFAMSDFSNVAGVGFCSEILSS